MTTSCSHARALATVRSLSLANRRQRPRPPKNGSTTQRRGNTANPCCPSGFGTISRSGAAGIPTRALASFGPLYPLPPRPCPRSA